MTLDTALGIYATTGPTNPRENGKTIADRASHVVHSFLKPQEIQELSIAWKNGQSTKAGFLMKLDEVRTRLKNSGFL